MLLPAHRAAKRQSFSIDSLAISSHAEEDTGRDTESPYLNYLENSKYPSRDYKANVAIQKQLPFLEPQVKCANFIVSQQMDTSGLGMRRFGHAMDTLPLHTTSTPKVTSFKRKRHCSTSTPPSSDDSNGEDKSALTDDISPGSGYMASDHEGDSTCSDLSDRKRKKLRTAFTGDQLRELEKRYKTQKYLTAGDRTRLAKMLGLRDPQVKTWFQNRRMKEKRQQRDEETSHSFSLPTGGVDVAQLAALGIFGPAHLGAQLGSPTPINYHFNSPPSPMESPRQPRETGSGPALSPGLKPSQSPEMRARELHDIYRTGHFLPSAQMSPHLMANHLQGMYASAFASMVPQRYPATSYNSPLLRSHTQST